MPFRRPETVAPQPPSSQAEQSASMAQNIRHRNAAAAESLMETSGQYDQFTPISLLRKKGQDVAEFHDWGWIGGIEEANGEFKAIGIVTKDKKEIVIKLKPSSVRPSASFQKRIRASDPHVKITIVDNEEEWSSLLRQRLAGHAWWSTTPKITAKWAKSMQESPALVWDPLRIWMKQNPWINGADVTGYDPVSAWHFYSPKNAELPHDGGVGELIRPLIWGLGAMNFARERWKSEHRCPENLSALHGLLHAPIVHDRIPVGAFIGKSPADLSFHELEVIAQVAADQQHDDGAYDRYQVKELIWEALMRARRAAGTESKAAKSSHPVQQRIRNRTTASTLPAHGEDNETVWPKSTAPTWPPGEDPPF